MFCIFVVFFASKAYAIITDDWRDFYIRGTLEEHAEYGLGYIGTELFCCVVLDKANWQRVCRRYIKTYLLELSYIFRSIRLGDICSEFANNCSTWMRVSVTSTLRSTILQLKLSMY